MFYQKGNKKKLVDRPGVVPTLFRGWLQCCSGCQSRNLLDELWGAWTWGRSSRMKSSGCLSTPPDEVGAPGDSSLPVLYLLRKDSSDMCWCLPGVGDGLWLSVPPVSASWQDIATNTFFSVYFFLHNQWLFTITRKLTTGGKPMIWAEISQKGTLSLQNVLQLSQTKTSWAAGRVISPMLGEPW